MRKQLSVIKTVLIVDLILSIIQTIFLCIEPDLKHIILSCVVYVCLVLSFIAFVICKIEVNKIYFETTKDDIQIRLIEEDDYQIIRSLLDVSPLENSLEEANKLEEYKKITIDFIRLHYHYLVLKNQEAKGIFYAKKNGKVIEIKYKNDFEEKIEINNILNMIAKNHNFDIKYKD